MARDKTDKTDNPPRDIRDNCDMGHARLARRGGLWRCEALDLGPLALGVFQTAR